MSDTDTKTDVFPEDFDHSIDFPYSETTWTKDHVATTAALNLALLDFTHWATNHPEFVSKHMTEYWAGSSMKMTIYPEIAWDTPDDEKPAAYAKGLLELRRLGGFKNKFMTEYHTGFFMDFGPVRGLFQIRIQINRQITCQMVPTGETEIVEVDEVIHPAVVEKVAKERPIMKRICVDSLGALAAAEMQAGE